MGLISVFSDSEITKKEEGENKAEAESQYSVSIYKW